MRMIGKAIANCVAGALMFIGAGVALAAEAGDPFALFFADHPTRGMDLYRTDGTAAGTTEVLDMTRYANLGGSWDSSFFRLAQGTVVVLGSSTDRQRAGIYAVDAIGALVRRVADGTLNNPHSIVPLRIIDGRLFFEVNYTYLYVTDGSLAGTKRVISTPLYEIEDVFAFGGQIVVLTNEYIQDVRGTYGRLYSLDETNRRVQRLFDFRSDGGRILSDRAYVKYGAPTTVTAVVGPARDRFVFMRDAPSSGREIWVSDGTATGTRLLKSISPGTENGIESWFLIGLGERALFFAGSEATTGIELWATDGTAAGTRRLRDIRPGPYSSELRPDQMVVVGGQAYFAASSDGLERNLWTTDGTPAGTRMMPARSGGRPIKLLSGAPNSLAAANGLVYFEGTEISGDCPTGANAECRYSAALYYMRLSTGAVARVTQTSDYACYFSNAYVAATFVGGNYHSIAAFGTKIFFSATGQRAAATTPGCGTELDIEPWVFDRRTATASRLSDIAPGLRPSYPELVGSR